MGTVSRVMSSLAQEIMSAVGAVHNDTIGWVHPQEVNVLADQMSHTDRA